VAVFPRQHLGQHQPGQDHRCLKVDSKDFVNVVFGQFVIRSGELHARVVDQNIYWPEFLSHLLKQLSTLRRVPQIRCVRGRATAAFLDGFAQGLQVSAGMGHERQFQPALSQGVSHKCAKPARSPGQENSLSAKKFHAPVPDTVNEGCFMATENRRSPRREWSSR